MKKIWCFLFHRKIWRTEKQYNADFMGTFLPCTLYYCSKDEWYFYGSPFNQEEE